MSLKGEFARFLRRRVRSSNGANYKKWFNFRSSVLGLDARVVWNGNEYELTDPSFRPSRRHFFRHETQGDMAYAAGLAARAELLGDAYRLTQIEFLPGDTVIDCGANVGDLGLYFENKNIPIKYIAFEPSPVEFSCLKKNWPDAECINVGLWTEHGEMNFFVSSQGADSSLIEPVFWDERITVKTAPLASYIDSPVKLLKLEAEGAEPEILEGAGEKIHDIHYISADLGYERGIKCESTLVPVTNYLLHRNFELVDVGHNRIYALYKNKLF